MLAIAMISAPSARSGKIVEIDVLGDPERLRRRSRTQCGPPSV